MFDRILKSNKLWGLPELIAKELKLKTGTRIFGLSILADKEALSNSGLRLIRIENNNILSSDFIICENDDDYNLLKLIDGTENLGLCYQL